MLHQKCTNDALKYQKYTCIIMVDSSTLISLSSFEEITKYPWLPVRLLFHKTTVIIEINFKELENI